MIYVVLGMHKSGTTLVSQILHQSDISMVEAIDEARSYDKGNQWERESTKQINHELLGSAHKYSLVARLPPDGVVDDPVIANKMRELINHYNTLFQDWGFKDPRTALVFGQWSHVLPEHVVIAVYRRPEEVWKHYWNSTKGKRRLTVLRHCLACWCEYNQAIINAIHNTQSKSIVISYSRLMQGQDEFSRLESFVGRPLSDERKQALNRSRSSPSRLYNVIEKLYTFKAGYSPQAIYEQLEALAGGQSRINLATDSIAAQTKGVCQ
jgi:hypothetical protein